MNKYLPTPQEKQEMALAKRARYEAFARRNERFSRRVAALIKRIRGGELT